ncbi:hypothetical protein BU23DRAFT_601744 [Bimuria novae-zelandiae CBS 107.79]|uniref:Uncharacterized protein n=1 Tax=Bimuria novae-zelandiae CBS 107.79 TaxID=1447943 RepID=A0A6A5V7B6_9PLEO|nr:hypothetical protein BU23DRAFT_601744 [Bimuria novae-zelandiae CBS 107.79]
MPSYKLIHLIALCTNFVLTPAFILATAVRSAASSLESSTQSTLNEFTTKSSIPSGISIGTKRLCVEFANSTSAPMINNTASLLTSPWRLYKTSGDDYLRRDSIMLLANALVVACKKSITFVFHIMRCTLGYHAGEAALFHLFGELVQARGFDIAEFKIDYSDTTVGMGEEEEQMVWDRIKVLQRTALYLYGSI